MRVDDGCRVVTITSAPKEEAEEAETEETAGEGGSGAYEENSTRE